MRSRDRKRIERNAAFVASLRSTPHVKPRSSRKQGKATAEQLAFRDYCALGYSPSDARSQINVDRAYAQARTVH